MTARRHSPRGVFWGAAAAAAVSLAGYVLSRRLDAPVIAAVAFGLSIVVAGLVSGLRRFDRNDGR